MVCKIAHAEGGPKDKADIHVHAHVQVHAKCT